MMFKPLVVGVVAAAMTAAAVVSLRAMRSPAASVSTSAGAGGNTGANTGTGTPGAGHIPTQSTGLGTGLPPRNGNQATEVRGGGRNNGNNGGRSHGNGHRQTRAKNGSYMTTIAGDFTGTGCAEVRDDKVSITADLLSADGRAGKLVANNLMVDGPYFYGSGTMLGETIQVSGRVDAARASRLVATISAGNGKAARIVGNLPAALDAGDDDWDDGAQPNRVRE
jgi:hypothetical protein